MSSLRSKIAMYRAGMPAHPLGAGPRYHLHISNVIPWTSRVQRFTWQPRRSLFIRGFSRSLTTHSDRAGRCIRIASLLIGLYLGRELMRDSLHLEDQGNGKEARIEQPNGQGLVSGTEVAQHNTREDCWVILEGMVYDVTNFLDLHPGGAAVILKKAGKDATDLFKSLHPPGILEEYLQPEQVIGPIDPTSVIKETNELDADEIRVQEARRNLPPIEAILNLQDMEDLAQKVMSNSGWAYYRSAADSEDAFRNNEESWKRYYFRPRVLRDARIKDPSSKILGLHVTLPVIIAPAAMAKLGHPLGEINMTRAAGGCGIIQGISSNASCGLEEMVDATVPGQTLIFQLYLNRDRSASARLLEKVERLGFRAIMFTVDAAAASKRTLDQRTKAPTGPSDGQPGSKIPLGVSQAISGYQDDNLTWDDIEFIRAHTKLPIIIKGIQCVEDVELAVACKVDGVVLSNHGGRQLNFAPSSIDVLYELRQKRPEIFEKIEVYVDGGIKSGTDVVKALALGAKGVGLGRAFLYGNACYGEEGVRKIYDILYQEICATMGGLGVHTVEELRPEMVERAWWLGGHRHA